MFFFIRISKGQHANVSGSCEGIEDFKCHGHKYKVQEFDDDVTDLTAEENPDENLNSWKVKQAPPNLQIPLGVTQEVNRYFWVPGFNKELLQESKFPKPKCYFPLDAGDEISF